MSHFSPANTPEKLLGRNDSKNPLTTCKGIASSGRPCRRALASHDSSPIGRRKSGVVAIVQEDGEVQEADYYCWQHKNQAEERVVEEDKKSAGKRVKKRSTELFPVKERTSIDTLVQRLGIDAIPEENEKKSKRKTKEPRPPRRTETVDFANQETRPSTQAPYQENYGYEQPARRTKPRKVSFWASLCCMADGGDDDYVEVVRHRKRVDDSQPTVSGAPRIPSNKPTPPATRPATRPASAAMPPRRPVSTDLPIRPAAQHRVSNSQTNHLLSLLPPHLSPQTTSALLAELIKPISPADEEGYIYIFWLTPQSKDAPAESTARSLLTPPASRPKNDRRISDVMTEFSFDGSEPDTKGKKTIMLKIGRANNVTRRMNEWQRQCGYALNLVRFYPYVPSSGTPSPQPSPSRPGSLYPDLSQRRDSATTGVRKVPYVKRVERLIHLELHEKQVKRQCAACGKEHREWFEVEASQVGIKGVDQCVKRWVGWAEKEQEMKESARRSVI